MCTTNIKQRRMAQMCRIPRHSVMNCFIWIVAWRSMLTIITLSSIILLLLSTNVVNGLESSLSEIDINPDTKGCHDWYNTFGNVLPLAMNCSTMIEVVNC
ncbi:hypothetical protein BLOT_013518 [Blomia tropicalis]|nr:hypothetical protein BLOT_013518 [Blomia tropicalis]